MGAEWTHLVRCVRSNLAFSGTPSALRRKRSSALCVPFSGPRFERVAWFAFGSGPPTYNVMGNSVPPVSGAIPELPLPN